MNRIAAAALIFSLSCAAGDAFAGAITPMVGVMAAASSATDLSVIQVNGTSKSKSSPAAVSTPAPKPKAVAPRPSLYIGSDCSASRRQCSTRSPLRGAHVALASEA